MSVLANGTAIQQDIKDAFYHAVSLRENQHNGKGINWNYVDADLNIALSDTYSSEYLYECFEVLVDNFFEVA